MTTNPSFMDNVTHQFEYYATSDRICMDAAATVCLDDWGFYSVEDVDTSVGL